MPIDPALIETLDEQEDAFLREEIGWTRNALMIAVVVVLAHVVVIWAFVDAVFHPTLPRAFQFVLTWFFWNGAFTGVGIWLWRSGRFPLRGRRWLRGDHAKAAIVGAIIGANIWWLFVVLFGPVAFAVPFIVGYMAKIQAHAERRDNDPTI